MKPRKLYSPPRDVIIILRSANFSKMWTDLTASQSVFSFSCRRHLTLNVIEFIQCAFMRPCHAVHSFPQHHHQHTQIHWLQKEDNERACKRERERDFTKKNKDLILSVQLSFILSRAFAVVAFLCRLFVRSLCFGIRLVCVYQKRYLYIWCCMCSVYNKCESVSLFYLQVLNVLISLFHCLLTAVLPRLLFLRFFLFVGVICSFVGQLLLVLFCSSL